MLITCPVTRIDELVADRRIRSVANHATAEGRHIAMHVECPACGSVHVYRTGRKLAAAVVPAREARAPAPA